MTGIETIEAARTPSSGAHPDISPFPDTQWNYITNNPDEPLPEYMRATLASATYAMMLEQGLQGVRPVFGREAVIQEQAYVVLHTSCQEALSNAHTYTEFKHILNQYKEDLAAI